MQKEKIYIAGPIANNPDYIAQFDAAEKRLRGWGGVFPINPARNQGDTYKDYIDIGLFELQHSDTIYLLKGWEKSTGARLEKAYAEAVGLRIIYEEEENGTEG